MARISRMSAVEKIDAMGRSLLRLRDEAIQARSLDGCEHRMRVDEETYNACIDDEEYQKFTAVDYAAGKVLRTESKQDTRSQVVVNVTRGRTEVCAGRLTAAAMPTDGRNWSLSATPDPEMDKQLMDTRTVQEATGGATTMMDPQGQEMTMQDWASQERNEAKTRMTGMESRIDDQFAECDAFVEFMDGFENSARLGTCVIKAPFIIPKTEVRFERVSDDTGEVWAPVVTEVIRPVVKSISPWDCYPSPGCGGDSEKMTYHWEKGEISPSDLRTLRNSEKSDYIPEQVDIVLAEPPVRTRVTIDEGRRAVHQNAVDRGNFYEKWEYHGDVDKEALEAMGLKVTNDHKFQRAAVLFVNDVPVKASLYPDDSMGLCYHYWQWSKVPGSMFGSGIPRAGRWVQKVIQGAFRAMMDNGRNVSGGHLVVSGKRLKKVQTAGDLTVWRADEGVDVRGAMNLFQITSNQSAYQAIIELALRFFDLETTTPMAFQGDKMTMPETLGATNILMDSGNVAIETRVTRWEKCIMGPVLKKFYFYNMMDPNCPSDIKGDYNTVCHGVKKLQSRDVEAKLLQTLMAMKQDPDYKYKYDWGELADQIFKLYRINIRRPQSEIEADEQKAAQQPPPPDPKVQAAEIKAQGDIEKAKMQHEGDMAEIQAKSEMAAEEQEFKRWAKQMDFMMTKMETMAQMEKDLNKVKADLAKTSAKLKLQRELTEPGAGGEVIKPPTEPGQRAPDGRSFQE